MKHVTLTDEQINAMDRWSICVASVGGTDDVYVFSVAELRAMWIREGGNKNATNIEVLEWDLKDKSGNANDILVVHEGIIKSARLARWDQ